MIRVLSDIFDPGEVAALREQAEGLAFEDGRATAGRWARERKANDQAVDDPAARALLERVERALSTNRAFRAAARPKGFARMLVSRYASDQHYGAHVDNAVMNGARTDLSFTVFLSPPDSYEGGDLVIEEPLEARALKPDAGEVALYPSRLLHRVEPVTSGARYAVVGWVTSWVRDPERREILMNLETSIDEVLGKEGPGPLLDRLTETQTNLLRLWAE